MRSLVFLLALFTGCSHISSSPSLSVRTLYHSAEKLSSVKEDTPDPLKPVLGKSSVLLVHWSSPSFRSPSLFCSYHFEDGTITHETHELEGTSGSLQLEINREFVRQHGSMNSYRIALIENDRELAASQHKLWVSPIDISE